MASSDWQEIYRSYSDAELATERGRLKKLLEDKQGLASQGIGSRSWANDLQELRQQFNSCVRVINERANMNRIPATGITDFSRITVT
jgi:hypothetical protein